MSVNIAADLQMVNNFSQPNTTGLYVQIAKKTNRGNTKQTKRRKQNGNGNKHSAIACST